MDRERLRYLLNQYLDVALTAEETRELEACLLLAPEARDEFWRHADLHATLRRLAEEREGGELAASGEPFGKMKVEPSGNGHAPVMPSSAEGASPPLAISTPGVGKHSGGKRPLTTANAEWFIKEVPLTDDAARSVPVPLGHDLPLTNRLSPRESALAPNVLKIGLAAAVLLMLVSLVALSFSWAEQPVAAKLIGIAEPRWQGLERLELGGSLPAGKSMRLEYGAVEFLFPGSATVVIRGPAEFQVLNRGRFALTSGDMTAHVPPRATGFVVESAGLVITDLGTEFAVSAEPAGRASLTVLDGSVVVETDPGGSGGVAARQTVLAGASLGRAAIGDRLAPVIPPAAENVPRDIAGVRVALTLRGAGVGLQVGDPDPDWRLTSVPDDPNWIARPAFVDRDELPRYMANDPAQSQWLLRTPNVWNNPKGVYVFEYTFDLPQGIDPGTVVVLARVVADNAVRHVRLNGQETGLHTPADRDRAVDKYSDLVLDHGFAAGRNKLEFDVVNLDEGRLSLRVALTGSGCLFARRFGDRQP